VEDLSRDQLQRSLASIGVGVIVADVDGRVGFLNPVAESLTGWSLELARGEPLECVLQLSHDVCGPAVALPEPEQAGGDEALPQCEEALLVRRDGARLPVEFSITQLRGEDGGATGLAVVFRDVSEQRMIAVQLARVTTHDLLTGLLNRTGFLDHLEQALDRSRDGQESVVCFLDLDQFKLVNETCGHTAGDDLLEWVAARLREAVGEDDVAARLGGDEFAILLRGRSLDQAARFAARLQELLGEFVFSWEDKSFAVSACVGVAPVSAEFAGAGDLLAAVDHACYMAKDSGRGSIQVWERGDAEVARRVEEMAWVARINQKLQGGEVRLYAQPIRPLSVMSLEGLQFEVLMRVLEPGGTAVRDPGQLVRAAERFGLMPMVDRWVVRSTLQALRRLDGNGLRRVSLCSINLSGLSLRDGSVLDEIREQLAETGIPPQKLCFEITETAAVRNLQQARWMIQELGSIGCKLALDDFGTGVASYSYLKELPVHYIKVAGQFVESMLTSSLDSAMVESINQISHLMHMQSIAESVGSRELYDRVRAIGIDHAQGFWVGMPRPLEEAVA